MRDLGESNVLKTEKRGSKSVLKSRVLAAEDEAKAIVSSARQYAEKLKVTTKLEAEEAKKSAFQEGRETALAELESKLLHASAILDNALIESERSLLKLSVKLAEKILGRELESDPNAITDIVHSALQNARGQQTLTLRVNPTDAPALQNEIEKLKSVAQTKFVDVMPDPRVEAGGCLIESEVGTVDARLETQFRVLRKALLARLEGETGKESV